ncbi:MAG: hypothetical protein ACPF8V_09730 [Luteibaculum sp.]
MKTLSKDILTGKGLKDIQFGMERSQVKQIMGEPDEVEQYEDEESEEVITEAWHYDDLELSISFDKYENWKLSTISVSEAGFTLNGKTIIGLLQGELTDLLDELNLGQYEVESWSTEDDDTQDLVTIPHLSINFWISEGKVTEIQWGPLYNEEEQTIWPN